VSTTVNPLGRSRCRRCTVTTARTAEQSQVTSSAPLAAAISAALSSLQLSTRAAAEPWTIAADPTRGVNAASAAMSAAVWAAALAPASAPTSTAATPASSTSPVNASPTRVAPPSSPTGQGTAPRVGRRVAGPGTVPGSPELTVARADRGACGSSGGVHVPGLTGRSGAEAGQVRERRRRWR
jgi:hypothetical protein